MTRDEVREELQEIFRMVFDDETLVINDATNPEDIEDWDSLEQINLIMQIHKRLKVKFSMEEAASLFQIGTIVDAILERNQL